MKKIIFLLSLFSLLSCGNNRESTISFDKNTNVFNIVRGEKYTTYFTFTNTGSYDLIIKSVQASCGCIIARYPKYSIAPDAKGKIVVTYDSNINRSEGEIYNDILVESNTNPMLHRLFIKGEVRNAVFDR